MQKYALTFRICNNDQKPSKYAFSKNPGPTYHHNAGQNHDIKIASRCFENVAQLRYLGTTVTNQNLIQKEIKRRLNSGNGCYHLIQNLLSSLLLSKNIKIRIYKTLKECVLIVGLKLN
jgi:hypothetical protein